MKKFLASMMLLGLSATAMASEPAEDVNARCATLEGWDQAVCAKAADAAGKVVAAGEAAVKELGECTEGDDAAKKACAEKKEAIVAKVDQAKVVIAAVAKELAEHGPPAKGGKAKRSSSNHMDMEDNADE